LKLEIYMTMLTFCHIFFKETQKEFVLFHWIGEREFTSLSRPFRSYILRYIKCCTIEWASFCCNNWV
jgi:hypothetical protein